MDSINQAVITKLRQRAELGAKKYGVTMDRTDLTELEWLEHAQAEVLDFPVYLEKLIQFKSAPCVWKQRESGQFDTACDNLFEFMHDGIRSNRFAYCPFCGRKIEEVK